MKNLFNKDKNYKMKRIQKWKLLVAAFIGVVLSSCDHNVKNPGYTYVEDMMFSDAYETYAPNNNFADGKTSQPAAVGTIPREVIPYHYAKSAEGMLKAGKELKNPLKATKKNIVRGKRMFNIYCSICHGSTGNGKGLLYESGKYPTEPATLISKDLWDRPEGEFYHVITIDSVIMGPHAAQIRSKDRWALIMYIKLVLQKNEKKRLEIEANKKNLESELSENKNSVN